MDPVPVHALRSAGEISRQLNCPCCYPGAGASRSAAVSSPRGCCSVTPSRSEAGERTQDGFTGPGEAGNSSPHCTAGETRAAHVAHPCKGLMEGARGFSPGPFENKPRAQAHSQEMLALRPDVQRDRSLEDVNRC